MKVINEGKTKIIYENQEDLSTVFMVFKDDITAGDGLKHDIIKDKSILDWRTNKNIYELLNKNSIATHYIDSPKEKHVLVKKLEIKINVEVVTRRVATGSIIDWGGEVEGKEWKPPITQFHYKDDFLHDPMLDKTYIDYITNKKGTSVFAEMSTLNDEVFILLEKSFKKFNIQLIDIKLEYGLIDDKLYVIDEITGGSFRLWPIKSDGTLDPNGRLDKDNYRLGKDLDLVYEKFNKIAEVTDKFKGI